jgi:uncharacterized integral membrane protein (TIGR00697 family)
MNGLNFSNTLIFTIKRKEDERMKKKFKVSELQVILTVLFVTSLLISNVITAKQLLLPFGITMTGAVIIFPITYILSDLFSEVYGYRWSRFTCYLAFAMNVLMVTIFAIVIETPAPEYWVNQEAFQTVLGSTPRVLIASLLAFVIGDLVNDKVFRRFKRKHPDSHKGFGFRAIVSSLCGEVIDSAIFLPLAFIGQMPVKTLLVMMITQVSIKTLYEIIILPLTTYIVKVVSKKELQH